MPAQKLLPPDSELKRMVQQGMTHAEIAAECERLTGHKVARSTVSAALSRAALTESTGHRYYDCIPWRVRPEHASEYAARMLRLLGRRRESFPLNDGEDRRLDSWLNMLERERCVVAYCPEHEDGFLYVDESLREGPNPEIPIRVKVLRLSEVIGQQALGEE
jgi:hypothetical protein